MGPQVDYSNSPIWSDMIPIPLNDGPAPLAAIAYTEAYTEATSYLRAVMAANEHSPRVLDLTADIISMNPAHYTVWIYRMATLKALNSPLGPELTWLNKVSMKNLKNYQIYGHRQNLITHYFPHPPAPAGNLPSALSEEPAFLEKILAKDTKNYHVWSYRQFLIRYFSLFDLPSEHAWTELMLERDVRNNSAWNHRWFLTFGKTVDPTTGKGQECAPVSGTVEKDMLSDETLATEIEYAISKIRLAPQNPSPWNYLRGVLRKASGRQDIGLALKRRVRNVAEEFVSDENAVKSSHALEYLAEVYADGGVEGEGEGEGEGKRKGKPSKEAEEKAGKFLDLLSERYDPIRKGYWDWRRKELGLGRGGDVTAVSG